MVQTQALGIHIPYFSHYAKQLPYLGWCSTVEFSVLWIYLSFDSFFVFLKLPFYCVAVSSLTGWGLLPTAGLSSVEFYPGFWVWAWAKSKHDTPEKYPGIFVPQASLKEDLRSCWRHSILPYIKHLSTGRCPKTINRNISLSLWQRYAFRPHAPSFLSLLRREGFVAQ